MIILLHFIATFVLLDMAAHFPKDHVYLNPAPVKKKKKSIGRMKTAVK